MRVECISWFVLNPNAHPHDKGHGVSHTLIIWMVFPLKKKKAKMQSWDRLYSHSDHLLVSAPQLDSVPVSRVDLALTLNLFHQLLMKLAL